MSPKRPAYLKIHNKKLALVEFHGCIDASKGIMYGKDEALYDRFHRRPLGNATIRALNRIVDEIQDRTKTIIKETDINAMLHGDHGDLTKVNPKAESLTEDCEDARNRTDNVPHPKKTTPCCGPHTYDERQFALADRFSMLYYQLVRAQADDQKEEEEGGIPFPVPVTVGYPLANVLDKLLEHPLVEDSKQRSADVFCGYIFAFDKDQSKLVDYMLNERNTDINNSFWYIVRMLVKVFSEKDNLEVSTQTDNGSPTIHTSGDDAVLHLQANSDEDSNWELLPEEVSFTINRKNSHMEVRFPRNTPVSAFMKKLPFGSDVFKGFTKEQVMSNLRPYVQGGHYLPMDKTLAECEIAGNTKVFFGTPNVPESGELPPTPSLSVIAEAETIELDTSDEDSISVIGRTLASTARSTSSSEEDVLTYRRNAGV
jgi:hypothetical protein